MLDVTVSCFANFWAVENPRPVNLLHWLISAKYAHQVMAIQKITDKTRRDKLKARLPAITPSGIFARRDSSALVEHSGVICLDIDLKGNEAITNYSQLQQEFCKIQNVAYYGLSVSGQGVFLLIPIAYPEQHLSHFLDLEQVFHQQFGVVIDSNCKDRCRLRGYSYNTDGYFNHQATPFTGLLIPKPVVSKNRLYREESSAPLERWLKLIEGVVEGERHQQLLKAARLAGGFIAGGCLSEEEAIEALEGASAALADV